MNTEEVVGLVLGALHPRLRERCSEAKILSVLEDDCGAYDVETLRSGSLAVCLCRCVLQSKFCAPVVAIYMEDIRPRDACKQ